MMGMNRICEDCGCDISDRYHNAILCKQCSEARERVRKKKWARRNTPKISKLGNPFQDNIILDFIQKRRLGKKTKKYKALPDSEFNKQNEAE